jgi:tripartite-type tricarboxylate transporter receptor subunit TctC
MVVLLAGVALLAAADLRAQDYPSRPVTIVVPYAAGGANDMMARRIGPRLEARLGKPVVVENRPGAATVTATTAVVRGPADGHTILLATSTTMAINVGVYKSLPYDPAKDLAPVALVANAPFMLVLNPSVPAQSAAELVAYSKSAPGGISYASTGHGSLAHLCAEMLKSMTGLAATHVPYKGTAPGMSDLVAGHVQMMIGDFGSALPLVRAGRLKTLGVTTAERVPVAPEIPSLGEREVPGYQASSWQMFVVAARTPKEIVARLNAELKAIMEEPEVRGDFSARGLVPIATPPTAELESYVKSEIVRWGRVVQQAGAAGIE